MGDLTLYKSLRDGVSAEDASKAISKALADSVSPFSAFAKGHRVYVELGESAELTDWIQITPGTGKWNHPRFGLVEISDETLERFVDNFSKRIYQEHIPVDAEHKTKLSGAFGYYREMKVGHDDKPGVWAKIELTERGQKLLEDGGFKYFSPEFYDEWEEPATGQVYRDVITGGAFTTRPFFKDGVLEPVSLREFCAVPDWEVGPRRDPWSSSYESTGLVRDVHAMIYDGFTVAQIQNVLSAALAYSLAIKDGAADGKQMSEETPVTQETTPTANDGKPAPATFSEEQLREFAELKASNDTLAKQFAEAVKTNEALADKVSALQTIDRERRFKELVTGHGGANDGGPHWFGEPEKHIKMLSALAKNFGEESEEFTAYVEGQTAAAKALADSPSMRELGSSSPEPASDTMQKVEQLTKDFAEKHNVSREEALPKVLAEHPELYTEYNKQFMATAKKGE